MKAKDYIVLLCGLTLGSMFGVIASVIMLVSIGMLIKFYKKSKQPTEEPDLSEGVTA